MVVARMQSALSPEGEAAPGVFATPLVTSSAVYADSRVAANDTPTALLRPLCPLLSVT